MKWIYVNDNSEVPIDKSIIVADCNNWIGQAFWDNYGWRLETFGETREIYFDKIERYFVLED